MARDFSVSGNPSPPWSYGSTATLGSAFNVYPVFSRSSVDQWSFGGLPNVWHNASTATVQQATNFTPPGGFGLHPGGGGEYSVVRWTAPAGGTFRITGYFMGLDSSYPTTTDVWVVLNNNVAAPLFSGYIDTYNQPLNFSFDVTAASGDTIDFAVGVGGNGFFGDATGLAALIALLTPPSPLVVTNTNDIGTGSLRQAINFVNANCAAQTITFDIPGTGVKTIHPASALPAITCSHAAIDGYSQPGSSKNSLAVGDNAVLLIELSGDLAGVSHGIAINTDSVAVSGLVINRFSGSGIQILAPINTVGSVVLGNFIGTDPSGATAKPNGAGIGNNAGATGLGIGSLDPGDRNLISGNLGNGIDLHSGDMTYIGGNYIGTDASGNVALANGNGVFAINTTNTQVYANTISGNGGAGIGLVLSQPAVVKSNFIGTNAAGTAPLPNVNGIAVGKNTSYIAIGGAAPGDGNVISGNTGYGVHFFGSSPGNTVWGNFIGTDASGALPLGNGIDGVFLNASSSAEVGCTVPGAGNVIANNRGHGVTVLGGLSAIEGNSIFGNAGLGINLNTGGTVQANDSCDADIGGNGAQNYPVIASAVSSGGSITVSGNLDSAPNATFRVEFFSNLATDNANNRAGRTFIGYAAVATSLLPSCSVPFSVTLPVSIPVGYTITATATDSLDNTGWFSNAVAVTGVGPPPSPAITLTPASLAFGARTVSTPSSAQASTLANLGPGALAIASMTLSGDYAFTTNCPATLAVEATCDITVTFTPIAAGARNGALTITSNATGSPHVLALSGTGQAAGVPGVQLSPTALTFPPQPVGLESGLQFVVLTNDGTAPLLLNSITPSGDFVMTLAFVSGRGPCGASVAVGASCEIGVAFRPAAEGLREGSLDVASNAPGSVSSVHLVGTGQSVAAPRALSVPAALAFAAQRVGTRSAGSAVRIDNNLGSTVSIVDLAASGDFSVSDTCTTIAAGATCMPLVFFQPAAIGDRTGTLTLRTLAETEPYVVLLSGIGTTNGLPELSVSATRIGFGNTFVGSAPTLSVNLSNIGMVPAAVRSISVAGGDFFAANECSTLAPGVTCVVHVTFAPRAPGRQSAVLQIASDAEASPLQVQVSGVGCYIPSVMRARQGIALCGP